MKIWVSAPVCFWLMERVCWQHAEESGLVLRSVLLFAAQRFSKIFTVLAWRRKFPVTPHSDKFYCSLPLTLWDYKWKHLTVGSSVQLCKHKTKNADAIGALISKQYFMLFYHFSSPTRGSFLICKKWNWVNYWRARNHWIFFPSYAGCKKNREEAEWHSSSTVTNKLSRNLNLKPLFLAF